ncbi:MAG: metallophosphoesterase [Oscillospiraceae bacterium]|nr:metallophosphoesterase [Oscillospiraceae bacterium]
MVYVTGDTHGEWERFRSKEMRRLRSGDTLLICGDFGFIWDGSRKERAMLRRLAALPYMICFVDGCHENFELLSEYPEELWNGGYVHRIARNIVHLMRGQIFTIEKHTYFVFGGGHSQDAEYRDEEGTFWPQERPTRAEIAFAIENLQEAGNRVDYIITHEPPASLKDCLGVDVHERLEIHTFFENMIHVCTYRKWFFGKCHMDKFVPVKYFAVFENVLPVTVKNTDL